jgi:hypothetical protein
VSGYRLGADLELAAKHLLEANGYFVVKSAGSKGKADLVALKRGEILLVQCKLDGYAAPAERAALRGMVLALSGIPGLKVTALLGRWHKEGRAARAVAFTELVSMGPAGNIPWTPDYTMEAM